MTGDYLGPRSAQTAVQAATQQNQQGTGGRGRRALGRRQPATCNCQRAHNYERYTTLAKDAARRGETIEAENLYRHAEHYFRVMRDED